MKKALVLGGMLLLVASSALATPGIDLSFNNCSRTAGTPGPLPNIDALSACQNGNTIVMQAVFQPNGAIPQIAAINGIMDMQISGDFSAHPFWNWFNPDPLLCNPSALSFSALKPLSGCGIYLATWSTLSASPGGGAGRGQRGPSIQRVAWNAFRDNNAQNVNTDQQCFAAQFAIDVLTSTESTVGNCSGCGVAACLVFNEARPESFDPAVVSPPLTTATGQGLQGTSNIVTFNSGTALCAAVPAKKKTWGQLKSLYR